MKFDKNVQQKKEISFDSGPDLCLVFSGVNCFEAFKTMQDCMAQYPTLYKQNDDDDEDLDDVKDESIRKEAQEKADRIIEQADSSSSHTNKK